MGGQDDCDDVDTSGDEDGMLSIENRGRRGGIGAWKTKALFVFTLSDVLKVYTGQPSTRRGRGFRQTTGDIFLSETFNPIFKMCKRVDLKQQFAKFGKSFYPMTTCEILSGTSICKKVVWNEIV